MKTPNYFSKSILLFLFCVTAYFSASAFDFTVANGISNINVNKPDKTFEFKLLVYRDASGADDDNLEHASIIINNIHYATAYSISYNPNHGSNTIYAIDSDAEGQFWVNPVGGRSMTVTSQVQGDYGYLIFSIEIDDIELYQATYGLALTNFEFEDAGSNTQSNQIAPIATGWEPINISAFTASNTSCNTVDLNWNVTLSSGDINDVYYKILANNNVIYTGSNVTSTVDFLSNPQPLGIAYTLQAGYGSAYLGSQNATVTGGPPRTQFDNPSNFSATNHRCDEIVLSWQHGSQTSNIQEYLITRLSDNAEFTTNKNNTTYTIFNNGLGGSLQPQNYDFQIQAVSTCDFKSTGVTTPSYKENLIGATNLTTTQLASGSIQLDWTDATGETEYEIIKNPTNSASNPIVAKDITTFIDNNVDACIDYTYAIKSVNNCEPNGVTSPNVNHTVTPDLTTTFSSKNFDASKGYHADKVRMEWVTDNNQTVIDDYVIERKELNANGNFILLATIPGNTLNSYDDLNADAGVLYEYKIFGQLVCNGIIEKSDSVMSIGFRSAFGTISGQVNYTGGIAVKDVKISAESTNGNSGSSLSFDGNGYLSVADNNYNSNELTVAFWIKPEATNTNDFTLFEKNGQYSLKKIGGNYVFELPSLASTAQFSSSLISTAQYNQITATVFNDSMKLFVNGLQKASTYISGNIGAGTDSLKIGENYIGFLDEFRLWDIGKTDKTVIQDFSRQLAGSEAGLKIYYRLSENLGFFAYDFSRQSNVLYNKNHASLEGNVSWSSIVPPANQLKLATYTNAQGNYVLSIPYSGNGETFTITPSYLTHDFTPSTRVLFLGDGSFILNNINFEDISSFTVQGSLFYANTYCAVENASLKVDGNIILNAGLPVVTDAQGNFIIQVPIGEHNISIEKQGHIMSVGRFPEFGDYDFQNDLAGVDFIDTTLVRVVGRVVGGLKEANYLPMNGRSENNIGQAQIIFKSQQGNGCYTETLLTDNSTGEYSSYLPPLKYVPTVNVVNNPSIDFGVLNLVDLSNATTLITKTDSFFNNNNNLYSVDSVSYNLQLDYIHREIPQIIVKETDLINDFIGDTSYTYTHPNGSEIVRNLKTDPLPWPVFNGIGQDKEYTCLITAYEPYSNIDDPLNPILDTVPVTDGTVLFNNDLCISAGGEVELSDVNTLDELNYIYYKFKLGTPNFNENINIPEYNFVKKFEINILFPDGSSIPWKPDVYTGTFSGQFNNVYDKIFRAYLLSSKSDGNQFVTAGPKVPDYILRDPPGSNSSATREIGSTSTKENNWSWSAGGSVSSEDQIFLGTKITTGLGVATSTEVENNLIVGFSAEVSGGNSGTESVTITNTQEWATNSNTDLPGKGSDLYIGKSMNITFGIAKTLKIIPDSLCSQVECVGSSMDSLILSNVYGLSIVPGGYETQFIYNEDHIKTYLIPELLQLREAIFTSNTKYTSHYPNTNPHYGLNNDDPRVTSFYPFTPEEQIEYILQLPDSSYSEFVDTYGNETHWTSSFAQIAKWNYYNRFQHPDSSYIDGYSYTYAAVNLQDSLTGDSVRWVNNQIKHWEEAIMLNEWEKVNIDDPVLRNKLKELELTKLYKKYSNPLTAYVALNTAGGVISGVTGLAALLTPLPGAAAIGASTLAVTTGTQIAANEVYEEVLQYGNQRQLIITKYTGTNANYSVSGGASFTNTMTNEMASSYNKNVEYGMESDASLEIVGKISNNGTGYTKSLGFNFKSERNWEEATESTESVSYTLDEPDQGDYFSVDVHPSLLGWGPIFKLRAGGRTSCPHEDAQLTEYYTEDPANPSSGQYSPFFPLGERTLQRDKPTITVAPSLLTNIPVVDAAVFNLTINNESESNDIREYRVALHSPSNPFGAIVRIDGSTFADLAIPPLSSLNKVLTVSKGPGPVYNYDSLLILVYAPCQYAAGTSDNVDIVDSVYISAHFLPTCTDVNFATPNNLWVLNNSLKDTLSVAVIDYNINFYDLNSFRLDYKSTSQSTWTGLQTFHKDTAGFNDQTAIQIPTITPFTLWDWETNQLPDGNYDLRLVSECALSDKTSVTHTGVMDRINPHPFGTPSPADGILDPNDDIHIKFNEPVELGSLTSLNFDVRGVINGSETTHASNLYFDGMADYVEVTGGANLQKRDFTIEFSVKRNTTGEEAIISQGTNSGDQLFVGFDAGNHLVFKINGISLNSYNIYTDNDWHYFAVAYNYDNETADIYEASETTTASIINGASNIINANYEGNNKLIIGNDAAGISNFFNGNIDDVRIWNVTRSLNEFSLTKSTLLSSNQIGLLYNWRFDDANGIFAEDHVRARNAILNGPAWTIEPGGSAIAFDGVDDYLKIQKGDVNISTGMDYTLEFWFKSTQTGAATLVSNGSGSGIATDSLYSWNINKDAAGNIHVLHRGIDFLATDSSYFDGEWHHFALVLNRLASLTSYVDGNLEKSMQSTPIGELGGANFYLGAKGYYVGAIETIDNYFDGELDEFRFWDASRKYEQISRDQHNRMKGDEFALRLYLPFEDYQLDPTGVAILTPGTNEQIDGINYLVSNPNGANLITTGPKIKIQRPTEDIAFTYSVNNDEIIITPTTNQALIENVTLDITVKNVKDLHGNVMESPKTWIAYMDKNQVVWQDDYFNFNKNYGAALNFSTQIVNNGGAAKDFDLENFPSWLTADIMTGTIAPNSAITVNFEVDSLINIGDYTQDIHLLTDFGFPEKLGITLKVREEEPNWTVNPTDFDYSMNVIGYLKIKNIVSNSEEDMLAAFVDGECRGFAHLQYEPLLDRYLVFLDIYSYTAYSENVSFQIWDASAGIRYSDITPSIIPFQENTLLGTVSNPQLFETNYEIIVDVPLVAGWNWVSNFLYNKDSTDVNKRLESIEALDGNEIKGLYKDDVAKYTKATNKWEGNLKINGIRPEQGYKIQVSQIDTLVLKGDILDPTSRTVVIDSGWTWIGFISLRNQSVKEALGNLNPTDGDLIKAQSQFAVYDPTLGWIGSLQTMIPGQGYMYNTVNDNSFVYPFAGMFKSGKINNQTPYKNKVWTVDYGRYLSNMTTIAQLESSCDNLIKDGNYAIGIFDEEGLCRGLSPIELDLNEGLNFLTSAGNNTENLNLRIVNNSNNQVYNLDEKLAYSSNSHLGNLKNPFNININEKVCNKMESDMIEAALEVANFKVYPSLIEEKLTLEYFAAIDDANATMKILNLLGQTVFSSKLEIIEGANKIAVDVSNLNLPKGVYHLNFRSGATSKTIKLISK